MKFDLSKYDNLLPKKNMNIGFTAETSVPSLTQNDEDSSSDIDNFKRNFCSYFSGTNSRLESTEVRISLKSSFP